MVISCKAADFASSDDASIYREIVRPFIRKGKQI